MRERKSVHRFAAPAILIVVLAVFFTLVFSAMAHGQEHRPEDRTPIERWFLSGYVAWDATYFRADDLSLNQLTVDRIRIRRPGDRFPRMSHQSHFSTLPLSAGARFGPGHDTEFRFRAGLADADVFRAPLAAGLTVLDYNRAGALDIDARWLQSRLGVTFSIGDRRIAVEPRFIGHLGIGTMRAGPVYAGLADAAGARQTGLEAGYRGGIAFAGERFRLGGDYVHRSQLSGPQIGINSLEVDGELYTGQGVALFARYSREMASAGDLRHDQNLFETGVRLVVRRPHVMRFRR